MDMPRLTLNTIAESAWVSIKVARQPNRPNGIGAAATRSPSEAARQRVRHTLGPAQPFSHCASVTSDLRVGIGPSNPGNTGPETLERSLATWQEVQEFFTGGRPLPMLVDRAPEHWAEPAGIPIF